jgi:flagellar hook protein FlgE
MGLYDAMNASVTGMNAQSNYLTNIGQNISNSSTVGYKQADTEFGTLVNSTAVGQTAAGGVTTSTRLLGDKQGTLTGTSSATELAVAGDGFFVVSDSSSGSGQNYLTRAGSFVPDKDGYLVNAAGYYLQGYSLANGDPTMAANSLDGMQAVNVGASALSAKATTEGVFTANLPSTDAGDGVAPAAPPTNYSEKTSLVMYDSLGAKQTVNVYFLNTTPAANATTGPFTWDVQAYDAADTAVPPTSIGTASLSFDTAGKLSAATSMTVAVPGVGGGSMDLDLSGMTQLAGAFTKSKAEVDGNAASSISSVAIGDDGTLSYQLADGSTVKAYTIPLASVASPNNLLASSGNVFSPNLLSGPASVGVAGTGNLGLVRSSTLEESTVDVATELTHMIVAQRNYQANSKMFSTGAQLMDTLINMQV